MAENYWRTWEKYLPPEKVDKRQPPVKAAPLSKDSWRGWGKE